MRLQPDIIKLDRSLIDGIDADPARRALSRALHHFAAEIGADLVAEGIERTADLDTLIELGITYGQGFLLATPDFELPPATLPIPSLASA